MGRKIDEMLINRVVQPSRKYCGLGVKILRNWYGRFFSCFLLLPASNSRGISHWTIFNYIIFFPKSTKLLNYLFTKFLFNLFDLLFNCHKDNFESSSMSQPHFTNASHYVCQSGLDLKDTYNLIARYDLYIKPLRDYLETKTFWCRVVIMQCLPFSKF